MKKKSTNQHCELAVLKKNLIIVTALLSAILLGGCENNDSVQEAVPAANAAVEGTKEEPAAEVSDETAEDENDSPEPEEQNQEPAELPDGIYTAEFTTDSSMFHVNETCDGKGTLTVENGEMTIHISLGSKKIINLYPGLAEDAAKEGAELLMPTEDTVTYSDGMTEEVYGFDVPVPYLDDEFDLALIGTKGKWYDHKVSVSGPAAMDADVQTENIETQEGNAGSLEDGTYSMEITFEGGSGKAEILSPVSVTVADGKATAVVHWSSPNYDYMIVDGEQYLPVNTEGDSVFEIPVLSFDEPIGVVGDTVAMSKPHEIEYTLTFHSDTAVKE